jgi:quercetin 2,3-dioxygenase
MTEAGADGPVRHVVPATELLEGEGMHVKRTIGGPHLPILDPFLLLDQLGPREHAPYEAKGAPDHPHRGFETVTYILEGRLEHKDSQGNRGLLGPGDVQWMTAGDGIVHSELPAPELLEKGGRMHGLQLWVNLPRVDKRMAPRYQDIASGRIPEAGLPDGAGKVRVIAGRFADKEAVIETRTPITYLHAVLAPQGKVTLPVPSGHSAFVYIIDGGATVGGEAAAAHHLVLLAPEAGEIALVAGAAGASAILVTGKPLREPVARWGPFVMNTQAEIYEAVRDFQSGRMGEIPARFV